MTVAVVVGSGSAGRRHSAALAEHPDVRRVVVVRRPESTSVPFSGAETVGSLTEALAFAPSVGVVAGPAPLHVATALRLLDNGCHVLVEKPLAGSMEDDPLSALTQPVNSNRVLVGYHLRFSDTARIARQLITGGAIGSLQHAELRVGQHLSQWRPGTDPASSVSSRVELGGGVLLELSHEIDAVRFLFGCEVLGIDRAVLRYDGAPTDGIVETESDLSLRTSIGVRVDVHLDMVAPVPFRRWTVEGAAGVIVADLLGGQITVTGTDGDEQMIPIANGERDRCETRLIDHLLDMSQKGVAPRCTIDDGIAVLDVIRQVRAVAGPDRSAATL